MKKVKALELAAIQDLNLAVKCGQIAIGDTKQGAVQVVCDSSMFNILNMNGESLFCGNRESTKSYLIENVYQVIYE